MNATTEQKPMGGRRAQAQWRWPSAAFRRPVLIGVVGVLAGLAPALADDPPPEAKLVREPDAPVGKLSQVDRQALERQVNELYAQVFQDFNARRFDIALKRNEQAIRLVERLYPESEYPRGHPRLASLLSNQGLLFEKRVNYDGALTYYRRALEMFQRLYPEGEYPHGHADLARSLKNLGSLLELRGDSDGALTDFRLALAMRERLYPEGHPDLARSLNDLGRLLAGRGDSNGALSYLTRALEMRERLYPEGEYPRGHHELAGSLVDLGNLLEQRGDSDGALRYQARALEMIERLYPKREFPDGHPDLAGSLTNLGRLLRQRGNDAGALEFQAPAVAMMERLYPEGRFPRGHPDLAQSLNNLGNLLEQRGDPDGALSYQKRALEMRERLYPEGEYPRGHPDLAQSLYNLGILLKQRGDRDGALSYQKRALEMLERLYPEGEYPHGHRELAGSLNALGSLFHLQGERDQAWTRLSQSLRMYQNLVDDFAAAAAESDAFEYIAGIPSNRDLLLSLALQRPASDDPLYALVWRTKANITRIVQRRQHLWAVSTDPQTQALVHQYQETQADLSRLALAPVDPSSAFRGRLRSLSERKADLQRQLAAQLPEFRRQLELRRRPHSDLVQRLPRHVVFIDLLRYYNLELVPTTTGTVTERLTRCYVAFLLAPGRPAQRVELGPAEPIKKSIETWRAAIKDKAPSPAASDLRRLVWEPLERHFPAGITTVVLAPDADLTKVPWAALQGPEPGAVLLEQYAFCLTPHGPALLDQLTAPPEPESRSGTFLVVGGVSYDLQPAPSAGVEVANFSRSAARGEATTSYGALPWTQRELKDRAAWGGPLPVRPLSGVEATTDRLVAELPMAHLAHLATHGFFADPQISLASQPRPGATQTQLVWSSSTRMALAVRNPLLLSGLVLAGANLPVPKDNLGLPTGDGGILTAEVIAGLPLHSLDLVVLSACETGLGLVAGGEGVFGLQRAFHMAGARTVVASLWLVDDDATTRGLMKQFYRNLADGRMSKAEALRQAQLTLRREALGDGQHPYHWAGWVLSGDPSGTISTSVLPPPAPRPRTARGAGTVAWATTLALPLALGLVLLWLWRRRHAASRSSEEQP